MFYPQFSDTGQALSFRLDLWITPLSFLPKTKASHTDYPVQLRKVLNGKSPVLYMSLACLLHDFLFL